MKTEDPKIVMSDLKRQAWLLLIASCVCFGLWQNSLWAGLFFGCAFFLVITFMTGRTEWLIQRLQREQAEPLAGEEPKPCKHKVVADGFGGMGDALVCVACGLTKYPEAFPTPDFLAKRTIIPQNPFYGHRETFPFVVKFPSPVRFGIDWNSWTEFYDRDGVLKPRT